MTLSPTGIHTLFEMLAYATGFRVFLWTRKRAAPQAFTNSDNVVIIAAGAIIGAVMKAMRGQADAARVRELVLERAE